MDDEQKKLQVEAKEKWGNTKAYKQSEERVGKMTDDEIDEVRKNGEMLTQEITDNVDKGFDSPEVQALIEKHYKGVNAFYDCDLEMYKKLGQTYVDDQRLTDYYERFLPGLATFMRDAINYYCDNKKSL